MSAVLPLGEGAWTVVLGDRVDRRLNAQARALAVRIGEADLAGVQEIVPAYATVTVYFDPVRADAEAIRRILAGLAGRAEARTDRPEGHPAGAGPERRLVVIPVRYDGADLEEVAGRTGLTRDDVVRRHAAPEYQVYLLGFAPGFAYLGDLDPALVLPRRSAPRARVPAGSVAIAGAQTAVYPLETPGGWHLLGTTTLVLFDPGREPPTLLAPGDRVRFEAIG